MNVLSWLKFLKMYSRLRHFLPFYVDGANSMHRAGSSTQVFMLLSKPHYTTFKQKTIFKKQVQVEICQKVIKSSKTPPTISWKSKPASCYTPFSLEFEL